MLWNASALKGYALEATDGLLGNVSDFLFNDTSWMARWLVVETGSWLMHRKVLLPPSTLGKPGQNHMPVTLTMEKIKNSPSIATDEPVSRQMESSIFDYYDLQPYWSTYYPAGGDLISPPYVPALYIAGSRRRDSDISDGAPDPGDPHLRSIHSLSSYSIHADDGEIGRVEDFLIDDADWGINYIKANTGNWWSSHEVLLTPRLVESLDWASQRINLRVNRHQVKESPAYDSSMTVDRVYEENLHTHYGYRW